MSADSVAIQRALKQLEGKIDRIDNATTTQKAQLASLESKLSSNAFLERSTSSTLPDSNPQGPPSQDIALDPVSIGDFLLLQTTTPDGLTGFLGGDAAFNRVGVQQQPDKQRTSLNSGDFVFRVCPMLNYRQRNELEASRGATSLPSTADPKAQQAERESEGEEKRALNLLTNRVLAEEKRNAEMMESVVKGSYGGPASVKYGDVVQLQHVNTGGFVCAMESAAPCDPECRAVKLDHSGSSAALFKFMPRYKAQAVGSIVYYAHAVVLESVKQRGMMLHTSMVAYSELPSPWEPTLPKCLQTGKTLETNLSPQFETYTVAKFARFGVKDASSFKTSVPFRLYHSQSEAFVHASCDAEKDRTNPGGRQADASSGGAGLVLPSHCPYLKKLPQTGESPDPTDPAHHSAKGVWCFEPLHRDAAFTISWEMPYRLRHVPSGRYLCVDRNQPFSPPESSNIEGEQWYPTFLVDDETGSGDFDWANLINDDLVDRGFKTVPLSWMTFMVSSVDKQTSDTVPDADISLRLEHSLDGGQLLYLHNTDERKARRVDKLKDGAAAFTTTVGVVLSSVRSSQDVFKVMRVDPQEAKVIGTSKAFLVPTSLYSVGVSDPKHSLANGTLVFEAIESLLKMTDMQIKGGLHGLPPPGEEWIKLANNTLPAAFSAKFGGAPEAFVQRIFRDTKLLDGVFSMGLALYARADNAKAAEDKANSQSQSQGSSQGDASAEDKAMTLAVQKLVHVALQRMVEGEAPSQDYFGRRKLPGPKGKKWIQTILDQLEDPLGAAVTLSKLLGANVKLMEEYANADLVIQFATMVRNLGPQPRLVNFFEAICTAGGKPVKGNQEAVLRLTWMNEEWRSKIYLQTQAFSGHSAQLPAYGDVLDPSGAVCAAHDSAAIKAKAPKDYIGKASFESSEGLPAVFVQWSGSDAWKKGLDELFWAPSKLGLGIPVYPLPSSVSDGTGTSQQWVRIEDLCWIQDPHRLCKAVTGVEYSKLLEDSKASPALAASLKAQSQLVDYYVGQLLLLSEMSFGRSYNVIDWLSKSFSYEMLASMCFNPYLPPRVRGASTTLVKSLYLDRYPQLHNCGRAVLPDLLWVYESSKNSTDTANTIKHKNLKDSGSLVEFSLGSDHPFAGNLDPFLGHQDGFKFFLLRTFGNKFLAGFGNGALVSAQQQENMMARTVMGLSDALSSFGFQSSLPKIKDLLKYMIPILDGRNDAASIDEHKNLVPHQPLQHRFVITGTSVHVTGLKTSIIKVLMAISNFRAQFRLGNLLNTFKEYLENPRLKTDLLEHHELYMENKTDLFGEERELVSRLFKDFEALFIEGDGLELQLEKLAGTAKSDAPMNEILLDCLMYEDDDLFNAALELLERTYGQRRMLREAFGNVVLLADETLPVFGNVAALRTTISYLTFLARSSEVWGVSSRVSGPFQEAKYDTLLNNCQSLLEYLSAGGGKKKGESEQGRESKRSAKNQETLRAANAHGTLTIALDMNPNISFEGSICSSQDKVKSRLWISNSMRAMVNCLVPFVAGNAKNQKAIWSHLPSLRRHLGPLKLPKKWPADFGHEFKSQVGVGPRIDTESVIVECLRGNKALCEFEVPKSLIEEFGSLLNTAPDPSVAVEVEFFSLLCQPTAGGKPLPRNQCLVLEVLLEARLASLQTVFSTLFGQQAGGGTDGGAASAAAVKAPPPPPSLSTPELLVDLLTATIAGRNLATATMLSAICSIESSLDALGTAMQASMPGLLETFIEHTQDEEKKDESADIRSKQEEALQQNQMFGSLLSFLAQQLDVLVVDPKLFRSERCWDLLAVGVNHILSAAAKTFNQTGGKGKSLVLDKKSEQVATAAARVAFVLIDGARSLGLTKKEAVHKAELSEAANSVFNSAKVIAGSANKAKSSSPLLVKACTLLANLIQPGAVSAQVTKGTEAGEEQQEQEERKDGDDEEGSDQVGGEVEVKAKQIMPGSRPALLRGATSLMAGLGTSIGNLNPLVGGRGGSGSGVGGVDPLVLRSYFSEALLSNPLINSVISLRRFALVECLESAGARTGPEAAKPQDNGEVAGVVGADGRGSLQIEWLDLVGRMVKYVRAHNFDKDQSGCLRVFRVLQNYLLKARCDGDRGDEKDPADLKEQPRIDYFAKQDSLVDAEVVDIVLMAITTHSPGSLEGALAEGAIDLLMELLNGGGNGTVAAALLGHIKQDPGSKFLIHLQGRMLGHLACIHTRKEGVESSFENMTVEQREGYQSCEKTFCVLQLMCEGHNRSAQDLVREQVGKALTVNLVGLSLELLVAQVEESAMLEKMEEAEVELLCTNMSFLIECSIGPCPGNQEYLVKIDGFTAIVEKIIQSKFHPRVGADLVVHAKEAAIKMVLACLEGRRDNTVHHDLASELEPEMFDMLKTSLAHTLDSARDDQNNANSVAGNAASLLLQGDTGSSEVLSKEEFGALEQSVMETVASLVSINDELSSSSKAFSDKVKSVKSGKKSKKRDLGDELSVGIAVVEVLWDGLIESVAFPIPKQCGFLTESTKEFFFLNCDLSHNEKRMKQLLGGSPMFDAEMKQVFELCSEMSFSGTYRFIHENLGNVKWGMYGTVVMLNINLAMASFGKKSDQGYDTLLGAPKDDDFYASLVISVILALINIAGYVVVMSFSIMTEVPIIVRRLDDHVRECEEDLNMREEDYRDKHAFDLWFVTLVVNVLFIVMHHVNTDPNVALYLVLILGINLPWTLSCVRNYIVVPDTPQARLFAACYDVIVTKPFFRNNMILMFFSIQGFVNTRYFAFMLLDILNLSASLGHVVRSVTDNGASLGLVLYLIIAVVIIYAQFGLEYFEDWFVYDGEADDEEARGCHSAVSCAFLIFYMAVPATTLSEVMDPPVKGDADFLGRMFFDLSFFVIVGVLLFNVITGLMVDGFGALRDEANERADVLENQCFVCGFTREAYEDLPDFDGPSFDKHKDTDHNYWHYVYFFVYLKQKKETDFRGVETYVWRMLQRENAGWVPSRNFAALQATKSLSSAAKANGAAHGGDHGGGSSKASNGSGGDEQKEERAAH